MVFSPSKDPIDLLSPLIMAGEDIKLVDTFKYLGILLDN
jgi:hypothetical protein